jgi:hypothetical protein
LFKRLIWTRSAERRRMTRTNYLREFVCADLQKGLDAPFEIVLHPRE